MAWPDYLRWLRRHVKAGEHAVIIGSTGSGKSWLAREVVPLFGRNVVVLDGKGGDDPSLRFPGFRTLNRWPPPVESFHPISRHVFGREPAPVRVLVTRPVRSYAAFPEMRDLFATVLRDLMPRKGRRVYALYVDEMQIIADPREGMGLGHLIGPLLRTKRYHGMSVVTATQYPTWIPKSSYRETTHRWFFPIEDEESSRRLGEISGHRRGVIPVLERLRRHEFLYQHVPTRR